MLIGLFGMLLLSTAINCLTADPPRWELGLVTLALGLVCATGGWLSIWGTYRKERALELRRAITHPRDNWVPRTRQFYCLISCAGDATPIVEELLSRIDVMTPDRQTILASLRTDPQTRDPNLRDNQMHFAGTYNENALTQLTSDGKANAVFVIPTDISDQLDRQGVVHDREWTFQKGPEA